MSGTWPSQTLKSPRASQPVMDIWLSLDFVSLVSLLCEDDKVSSVLFETFFPNDSKNRCIVIKDSLSGIRGLLVDRPVSMARSVDIVYIKYIQLAVLGRSIVIKTAVSTAMRTGRSLDLAAKCDDLPLFLLSDRLYKVKVVKLRLVPYFFHLH